MGSTDWCPVRVRQTDGNTLGNPQSTVYRSYDCHQFAVQIERCRIGIHDCILSMGTTN